MKRLRSGPRALALPLVAILLTSMSGAGLNAAGRTGQESAPPAALAAAEARASAEQVTAERWRDPEGRPLPFAADEEVLEFLREAAVLESEEIDVGITRPERLLLERDGLRMRAIFRHGDLQQREARLRGRYYRNFKDSYLHEVAAYELSRLLGLDRVPPAVPRTFEDRPGSVQAWVEDAFTEKDRLERGLEPPNALRWRRERQLMRAFDALIHNIDRNQGNVLYDAGWRLWFIDHTRSFRPEKTFLELKKIYLVDREFLNRLAALREEEVEERLGEYLTKFQVVGLWKRRERLLEYMQELIDSRGEAAVLFSLEEE